MDTSNKKCKEYKKSLNLRSFKRSYTKNFIKGSKHVLILGSQKEFHIYHTSLWQSHFAREEWCYYKGNQNQIWLQWASQDWTVWLNTAITKYPRIKTLHVWYGTSEEVIHTACKYTNILNITDNSPITSLFTAII